MKIKDLLEAENLSTEEYTEACSKLLELVPEYDKYQVEVFLSDLETKIDKKDPATKEIIITQEGYEEAFTEKYKALINNELDGLTQEQRIAQGRKPLSLETEL